jgi:hypothetical protein
VHDLTMLREGGLLRYLRDDEYILGDSGYLGEPQVVASLRQSQIATTEQQQYNYALNHYRVLIENVISRINNWCCLSIPWRHSLDLHPLVFWVICQITNIDMSYRPVRVE